MLWTLEPGGDAASLLLFINFAGGLFAPSRMSVKKRGTIAENCMACHDHEIWIGVYSDAWMQLLLPWPSACMDDGEAC